MKKIGVGSLMLAMCAANVFAADFPYDVSLTTRHETNDVTLASFVSVSVPKVNGGMPGSDSVAEVLLDDAAFTALDDDGWVECTNELAQGSVPQAAFTLKEEGDTPTYKWMGFTGGEWREFTGVAAAPGTWDVKIELDYSLSFGGGTPNIRYLIRAGDSTGAYTPLSADSEWVTIGNAAPGRITDVQLSGYCTVAGVSALSGARGVDGTVAKVADVSLNYSNLSVNVAVANTWGATNLEVVVKNAGGQTLGTKNVALDDSASYDVDLTEFVHAGESYTYEANLSGGYNGSPLPSKVDASPNQVDLFATIDWFGFADSTFVRATTNNLVVEDGAFHVDDDESEGVVTPATPASGSSISTEVTTTIDVVGVSGDLPAFESGSEPQFAITLGGTDDARVWKYYNGNTKEWVSSPTEGLPTTNGVYVGRATFNYAGGAVTYEIRPDDATSYGTLVANCPLPSGKTKLDAVAISGGGSVSAMNATCKLVEPPAPTVSGSTIAVATNAKLDLGDLSGSSYSVVPAPGSSVKGHLSWTDSSGKYATLANGTLTVHSGTPANGMESFHSYVLGLDPAVATDVPAAVVASLKVDNDGIAVKVPNVTPAEGAGCAPKLQLQRSSDGTTWETVSVHDIDAEVKIPLADAYRYRVNTIIQ